MQRRALWKLSIRTHPEAQDALAELLSRCFGQNPASYTQAATGKTTVTLYLHERPASSTVAEVEAGLARIQACGLKTEPATVSLTKIAPQNWSESWKRHFRPLEIGSALLIKPSWSGRRPRKGQSVVVLDPGLSFGTGQHPTTAFCLQQVVSNRLRNQDQSLLDIGTGSGILAIAAAKLGYRPIHACDSDPEAIRIARANARQNGVARRIHFFQADLRKVPLRATHKYSIICANLLADLLLAEQRRILARLSPGGILLLAGILRAEFTKVRTAYENAALKQISTQTRNEWRSAAFHSRRSVPVPGTAMSE